MCDGAGWELGIGKQGKTRVRARVAAAGRRCGVCHIPARHNIDMALRHWGAHGDNCEVQYGLSVRKKPRFTHVRENLRGDVSGKRFNVHVVDQRHGSMSRFTITVAYKQRHPG